MTDKKPRCICGEINARNCPVHQQSDDEVRDQMAEEYASYLRQVLDTDEHFKCGWDAAMKHRGDK